MNLTNENQSIRQSEKLSSCLFYKNISNMYSESSNVINFVTGTVKRLRDNIKSKDGKPARMDDIRKGEFLECPQILENQIEN